MSQTTASQILQSDSPRLSVGIGYRSAVRCAVVAWVFTALVCLLLLVDLGRRKAADPLDSAQYQELKASLALSPGDEEIKQRIRQMDLVLRKDYFRQRRFTALGVWLLLGGAVVFLVTAKSAVAFGRKPPMPGPLAGPQDLEAKMTAIARPAVAALLILLVVTAIALSLGLQTELPRNSNELAALSAAQPADDNPDGDPADAPAAAAGPSAEEMAAAWPRFRGPGGLGISNHKNVPTTWNGASSEGILWKTLVPLQGNNSPIVFGSRVFLSGATESSREVYCFDADSGNLVWQKPVPGTPLSNLSPPEVMEDTGYAAPTMATDGVRVFASFANGDVAALDFDGNDVWAKSLGIPENSYGHASSLTTFGGRLLIQLDQGKAKAKVSKVLALDAVTGETAWSTAREVPSSWPTPIVIQHEGSPQLITCADPWVIAYNPADGKELWRVECLQADVGPSPVFADGVVYAANEFPCMTAIKIGDGAEPEVLWEAEDSMPDTCTPLATDQFVIVLASYGILTAYAADSGRLLWELELDGTFTTSPSLVGKLLYLFDVDGKCWVLEPGLEECKTLAESDLGEPCVTSPAFADGRFYIRGAEHLICVGAE